MPIFERIRSISTRLDFSEMCGKIEFMGAVQPNFDPLADIRTALAGAFPGSPDVIIGVIDGLPDLDHPALRTASIEVLETMILPGEAAPDRHGTEVCSVIFGSDDPVQGLAPGCSGLVLPIFFGTGGAGVVRPTSQLDLARAITFALERGVSIINVSAGRKTPTIEPDAHLSQALVACYERRVPLVAAAGNDGCPCIHLPAVVGSVLAVGALNAQGRPHADSNWGEPYRQNGILAPGEGLAAAIPGGGVITASGTSFATAVVSSVAALLLSVVRHEGYELDGIDIQKILIDTALPCTLEGEGACDRFLAGTLDAAAALAMVHSVGRTRPSWAAAKAPLQSLAQIEGDNLRQHMVIGRGISMSDQALQSSSIPAAEAPNLSPSSAETKVTPADDTSKPEVTPQSITKTVPPPASRVVQNAATKGLIQQECACGGGQPPQIVYALGSLWFDFGTEARHDVFLQHLNSLVVVPGDLIGFLQQNLPFVSGLTFILMQEQIPIYAIQPAGPFAGETYQQMLEALQASLDAANKEQRVSVPGFISGSTRLLNGMVVPVVYPDLRGLYRWRPQDLVAAAKKALKDSGGPEASDDDILNFLNVVYDQLRNLGVAPQDRAINYAATNAYQATKIFAEERGKGRYLKKISVTKSPICRPDSDCWDVQLTLFSPDPTRQSLDYVHRFTVDVSEVIPVTVGDVRSWTGAAA